MVFISFSLFKFKYGYHKSRHIESQSIKLLNDLAELNLISIQNTSKNDFAAVLNKLRAKAKPAPSLDEITKEVELVRTKRYAKQG